MMNAFAFGHEMGQAIPDGNRVKQRTEHSARIRCDPHLHIQTCGICKLDEKLSNGNLTDRTIGVK